MIEAVVVAAGRGSRLGNLTRSLPKPLMMLEGKTLLHRNIQSLRRAGIDRITIVTGYSAAEIDSSTLQEEPGVSYIKNLAWESSGVITSFMSAHSRLNSESALLVYGDIVYESRLISACSSYLQHRDRASEPEVVVPVNTEWEKLWRIRMPNIFDDVETLVRDGKGNLVEIGQTVADLKHVDGQFMGVVGMTRNALLDLVSLHKRKIRSGSQKWDTTSMLMAWVNEGRAVRTLEIDGGWLEVDTVQDLMTYRELAFKGRLAEYCTLDV